MEQCYLIWLCDFFLLLSIVSVVNMNLKLGLVLLGVCYDILPSAESVNLWSLGKEVFLLRDCKSGISGLHEASVGRGTF